MPKMSFKEIVLPTYRVLLQFPGCQSSFLGQKPTTSQIFCWAEGSICSRCWNKICHILSRPWKRHVNSNLSDENTVDNDSLKEQGVCGGKHRIVDTEQSICSFNEYINQRKNPRALEADHKELAPTGSRGRQENYTPSMGKCWQRKTLTERLGRFKGHGLNCSAVKKIKVYFA